MRRYLAASVLLTAIGFLVVLPVPAQRGAAGAHFAGGRGNGGFSAPVSRGFNSVPLMNRNVPTNNLSQPYPAHSFVTAPRSISPGFRSPSGYRMPSGQTTGWGRAPGLASDRDHHRYRRPYLYAGSTYLTSGSLDYWPSEIGYPEFSGDYDTSGQPISQDAQNVPAPEYADEQDNGGASQPYRAACQTNMLKTAAVPTAEPELTVIFKDGHSQQIHNYALTRDTLIVLDSAVSGRESRIPLDAVDLPATEHSASNAGLDFMPPTSN